MKIQLSVAHVQALMLDAIKRKYQDGFRAHFGVGWSEFLEQYQINWNGTLTGADDGMISFWVIPPEKQPTDGQSV